MFTVSSAYGNGKLTYPVALLTADEAVLAGQVTRDNVRSYLYTGEGWCTITPYIFNTNSNVRILFLNGMGQLYENSVNLTYSVRPSISLAPRTLIAENTDGSGENPFVVLAK